MDEAAGTCGPSSSSLWGRLVLRRSDWGSPSESLSPEELGAPRAAILGAVWAGRRLGSGRNLRGGKLVAWGGQMSWGGEDEGGEKGGNYNCVYST